MEAAEVEEALKVLDASLSHIKWRLKSSSKRRLQTDVLALCTRMRPVVMIDYGGKMPELQENLCAFLEHSQKESPIFEELRVMVIEDMIYLIHVKEMAKHVSSSLSSEMELLFVDLEQDPPKMRTLEDKNLLGMQLTSIQKLFSLYFPLEGMRDDLSPPDRTELRADSESLSEPISSRSSLLMDLSSCMHDTKVTVPTIKWKFENFVCNSCKHKVLIIGCLYVVQNGLSTLRSQLVAPSSYVSSTQWLLGYPVVYLFSRDQIGDAVYNLSTKFLRIYKILASRKSTPNKGSHPEELMSFSVPYDLSMRGSNEPWAEKFLARLQSKWGRCKQAWSSLEMEVSECYPQAIAL